MPGRRGSFPPNCFLKVAQFTVSAASYVPSQIRVCEYEWMQTRLLALIVAESVVLSRSVVAVEVITPTDRQTDSRAFQFGRKFRFDSILATGSIFFDSIWQSDKFAACTLILK